VPEEVSIDEIDKYYPF
jgi:hypothetical protein